MMTALFNQRQPSVRNEPRLTYLSDPRTLSLHTVCIDSKANSKRCTSQLPDRQRPYSIFTCALRPLLPDPPVMQISASGVAMGNNVFLRITPTSDPVIQYGLLPGTSAVFDCSEPGHFSYPLEIQWRTFIDSAQDRSALTAVTSVNRSLPLNVSSAGAYLCMATKKFADCEGATTSSMLTLQVNDLIIRKAE